jgi:hypothetical protein
LALSCYEIGRTSGSRRAPTEVAAADIQLVAYEALVEPEPTRRPAPEQMAISELGEDQTTLLPDEEPAPARVRATKGTSQATTSWASRWRVTPIRAAA